MIPPSYQPDILRPFANDAIEIYRSVAASTDPDGVPPKLRARLLPRS